MVARKGDVKITSLLLEADADVEDKAADGEITLHIFASSGNLYGIQVLLAEGADVEAKNFRGLTALFSAARTQSVEVIKALILRGASIDDQEALEQPNPFNPFDHFTEHKYAKAMTLLRKVVAEENALL